MKEKFFWSTATAAAQIEGGYLDDGRSPSIWDELINGKIKDGSNPHIACDSYHRYQEDIDLMTKIGVNAYRFSLSWSRIMPKEGEVNLKGIAYYNRLINSLIKKGITPMVTIYHWDMPMWVYQLGGWKNKRMIPLFEEYVRVVTKAFSDRVKYWFIFNEPMCFIVNAYFTGAHAPFKRHIFTIGKIAKIALKAHGHAVRMMRRSAKQEVKIGIAQVATSYVPRGASKRAIKKAYRKSFGGLVGTFTNNLFSDPLFINKPVHLLFPICHINKKDLAEIYAPIDFIGINHYRPFPWLRDGKSRADRTTLNWEIVPEGMYWTLKFYHHRYHLPLLVSENGCASQDELTADQKIHDPQRIKYLTDYLAMTFKAKNEGVPIFGYTYWSLLDNFEWAEGYTPRFGLTYVDYQNGNKRYLKDSAFVYRDLIKRYNDLLRKKD